MAFCPIFSTALFPALMAFFAVWYKRAIHGPKLLIRLMEPGVFSAFLSILAPTLFAFFETRERVKLSIRSSNSRKIL